MPQANIIGVGTGIYTVTEISRILRIPYFKVNRWLNKYWDGELGKIFNTKYSRTTDGSKAVSFHTLIEFYIVFELLNSGVKITEIVKARIELSKITKTLFPFAQKAVLENIKSDGSKIFFNVGKGDILSLDGTKQLNISFVQTFFKNLDFDNELLASKFWPLGKSKNIIVDPSRKFGHPVIEHTNIYPEAVYNLFKAGEPVSFISFIYDIKEKDVYDAIEFCQAA
jgi:uncharacterized protein (DUF433 family)